MKTLTSLFNLILFSLLTVITLPAMSFAQSLADEIEEAVRAEVLEQHRLEQKAFIEGDCETVISFYDDEATIYREGRRVEMPEILEFCKKVPRPFRSEGGPHISDSFYVLSENAAHFVRTIDLEPADDNPSSFKREVITKVWFKTANGWKIVHFHSSVHSIKVPAMQNNNQ
jgi:ketosteroid isomerase-like protein